jgi:hypothetical protein
MIRGYIYRAVILGKFLAYKDKSVIIRPAHGWRMGRRIVPAEIIECRIDPERNNIDNCIYPFREEKSFERNRNGALVRAEGTIGRDGVLNIYWMEDRIALEGYDKYGSGE